MGSVLGLCVWLRRLSRWRAQVLYALYCVSLDQIRLRGFTEWRPRAESILNIADRSRTKLILYLSFVSIPSSLSFISTQRQCVCDHAAMSYSR